MKQREIRFRAWDKALNEMLYFDADWASMLKNDRWVIMQYSGLKDKNGKKVYEGDIVAGGFEIKFGHFYAYLENGLGAGYYITGFYYVNEDGISVPVEDGDEVIGNIFENPELLKQ